MNRTIMHEQGQAEKFAELFEDQMYNTIQEMAVKKITRAAINARFLVDLVELDNLDENGNKVMIAEIPLAMTMKIEKAEGPKEV